MHRTLPLLFLLACGGWAPQDPSPSAARVATSTPRLLDGAALAADIAGPADTPRLYAFWATWCAPCVAEMPTLRNVAASHRDLSVVLVNVDVPHVREHGLDAKIAQLGVDHLPQIWLDAADPNAALVASLPDWPRAIPYLLLVDAEGNQQARFVEQVSRADLEHALARLP